MNNKNITSEQLATIKTAVITERATMLTTNGKSSEEKAFQIIHGAWLDTDKLDKTIVDGLNTMKNKLNMSGATHALSLRLRVPKDVVAQIVKVTGAKYYVELGKMQLAKTIIQLCMERDILMVEWKTTIVENKSGKMLKQQIPWIQFEDKKKTLVGSDGLPYGLSRREGLLQSKGLKVHPWETSRKYTANEKTYLRSKASNAFRLIKKSADWWTAYFEATEWYKDAEAGDTEDTLCLDDRVENYVKTIMEISKEDELYMSWWLDARGRSYLDLQFAGIKVHGDSVEKHIWELASPWTITLDSVNKAIVAVTTIVHGKLNADQAFKKWDKHEKSIRKALFDKCTAGDCLYHEGLLEIIDTGVGGKTHRLIGEDLSTNGLAIFGSNFRYIKPMKYSNIGGLKTVQDAHGEMRTSFAKHNAGITRKDIKDNISTPLFHGSGVKSMSKQLSTMGMDFSPIQVRNALVGTFGEEIILINRIAHWTKSLISNTQTSLKMTSPDGNFYLSQAYSTKNKMDIQGLSFSNKGHRAKTIVVCNMPILFSNDGKKTLNTLQEKTALSNAGEIKHSGGYANITHMLDGYMLRQVSRYSNGPILDVHDNFFTEADVLGEVCDIIKTCHKLFHRDNYFEKAMQVMAFHHENSNIKLPHFVTGKATVAMIENSTNFLQQ